MLTKAKKGGNLLLGAAGPNPKLVAATFVKGKAATGSANVAIDGSVPGAVAVRVTAGAPYLKMQVSGYYEKPLAGFISPSGAPYAGSSRILGATRVGTGVYEVQFDRNIRYCASTVTPYVSAYFASASTWYDSTRPDTVRVWLWDASGTPQDQYFYIDVEC